MNEWNCRSKKRSDLFECYLQGQNWTCRISLVRDASDTDQSHVPVFTVSIVSTEDTRHSPSTSCAARPVPVTLAQGWVEDHAHCQPCLLHNVYRLALFAFPWCCCARVENRISGFIYLIFFFWCNTSRSLTWFSCCKGTSKITRNSGIAWKKLDSIIPCGGGLHVLQVGLQRLH